MSETLEPVRKALQEMILAEHNYEHLAKVFEDIDFTMSETLWVNAEFCRNSIVNLTNWLNDQNNLVDSNSNDVALVIDKDGI